MPCAGKGFNLNFSFFLAVRPACGFTTWPIEICCEADRQGLKN
jgi:hypothetical protein